MSVPPEALFLIDSASLCTHMVEGPYILSGLDRSIDCLRQNLIFHFVCLRLALALLYR